MFNDSTTPKIAGLAERFQQLNQLMWELPIPFVGRSIDSTSVWDITNRVCDRHHIENLC
jgi:hypothetical protein